jgi:hypothetical protein
VNKLIEFAYGITDRELVAPDWLEGESFDIVAVAPGPSTKEQMYKMLRSFLTEQFKLQIHHESHEQPVYALVVAKGDGIYHFNLTWTLDQALNSAAAAIPDAPPQLFTAIEEQLGLKLTPQRGPVDTIVVDHCEKTPAGN